MGSSAIEGVPALGSGGGGAVTSVAGRTGDVVIVKADLADLPGNDPAAGTAGFRTLGLTGTKAMPGTATLDQIANPVAARAMGSQKITGLANGTAASDGAAFGQIPVIATSAPLAEGAAAIGAAGRFADEAHVHPASLGDWFHCGDEFGLNDNNGGLAPGATLTPTFYPLLPRGRHKFAVTSIAGYVQTLVAANTFGCAIYSIVYSGAATFAATLAAQMTAGASTAATGVVLSDVTSAPVTLDFTANQYVIGMMVSNIATGKMRGLAAISGLGAFKWTAAARASTIDWPGSFDQSSVGAIGGANIFGMALVTAAGKNWI